MTALMHVDSRLHEACPPTVRTSVEMSRFVGHYQSDLKRIDRIPRTFIRSILDTSATSKSLNLKTVKTTDRLSWATD